MLQGEGYHKDNAGHDEIVKAGDVQWMFAGKGVLHSEGPSQQILNKGGTQEFVQLWINVPKARKWDEPTYQSAAKDELINVLAQEGVHLRLASGEFDGMTGPIKSHTPVVSIVGEIDKGQTGTVDGHTGILDIVVCNKRKDLCEPGVSFGTAPDCV
jgi:redox-sensitive bicupin YhaK (pirin superfamily)